MVVEVELLCLVRKYALLSAAGGSLQVMELIFYSLMMHYFTYPEPIYLFFLLFFLTQWYNHSDVLITYVRVTSIC